MLISDTCGHTSLVKLIIIRWLDIYGDFELAGTARQLGRWHVFVVETWPLNVVTASTQSLSFRIILLLRISPRNCSNWTPHFI